EPVLRSREIGIHEPRLLGERRVHSLLRSPDLAGEHQPFVVTGSPAQPRYVGNSHYPWQAAGRGIVAPELLGGAGGITTRHRLWFAANTLRRFESPRRHRA